MDGDYMKIDRGDLWKYDADWRIITTNGVVKKNGEAVMGRGTAYQAKKRYPKIAYALGQFLNNHGNHVGEFIFKDEETGDEVKLLTMPTKHHWIEGSDLVLIERSALELSSLPYSEKFVLTKPGCGNGGLDWCDVKLVIEKILDDRFTVLI
jgi:hypothetical protein